MSADMAYLLKGETFAALVEVLKEHRAEEAKKLEVAEPMDDVRKAQGAIEAIDRIIGLPEHYEQEAAADEAAELDDEE